MGQVSLVFIHFTPFTSRMGSTRVGSLGNGLQRRVDPISILYFTTFLPAFSAIWRRRYPLFRTLDTGKRPSFFYDKGKRRTAHLSVHLLNKLSLIQRPCTGVDTPCMDLISSILPIIFPRHQSTAAHHITVFQGVGGVPLG